MLKHLVDSDALLIGQILSQKEMVSVQELGLITGYRESYIHLILGWLLKENKILFSEKEDNLYIELSN